MPDSVAVIINEKEYFLAPLKMKHLKEITRILDTPKPGTYIDRMQMWNPYLVYSIQQGAAGQNNFNPDELDDLSVAEYQDLWKKVQAISGISLTNKPAGETQPVATAPTGDTSTAASV